MTTQSGTSSSPHIQRWRPPPQAAQEDEEEKEKDRRFRDANLKTSGPQRYKPWSGPSDRRVPPVSKTASTGEPKQASSTSTRRGADTAPEAAHGSQYVPPSSTKASSAGANRDAQRPAAERTSSQPGDSQSTRRTTTARTVSFDDRPSDSPMSTSSVPPGRPQPPQERTPPRPLSTDKTTGSQKATVESDVDEDATDSQVEKGSNRPPASTTHAPVSSKAVVDDTSSSKTAEEQPIPLEREHRLYSQAVNERISLRPPSTNPTSDGTRSTRQDMESNDRKREQEVQEQQKSLRQMEEEEERQRAQARAQELQEREPEKQRQEMEARDRELAKQLQEAEQRERLRQTQEAEQRERLRKKQEDEQHERSLKSERIKKEQEEFARRAEEATRRHQERKRTEDDEKERERWRRATGRSSGSGTPHQSSSGGGTSSFPRSPPPFGSFGSASPASFSSAGSASTQDVAAAWEKYDKAWAALKESAAQAPLLWRDIPWPIVAQPSKSGDLVNDAIANFIPSPTHSQSKSPKERIREALLKWHPDQFGGRWLSKCAEKDREEIKAGVDRVAGCLNQLLKRPTLPLAP